MGLVPLVNEDGSRHLGLDMHRLNTRGRESISGKAFSRWC
jgi:hypothetical protein